MRAVVLGALLVACARFGVDRTDEHGMTALMRAARAGATVQARQLVERGADPNARVPSNDLQVFIAFISWMQEVPHRDVGWTPLMYAASEGHVETARLLIASGADPNRADRDGDRALELAIRARRPDVVRLLLESHATLASERAGRAPLVDAVAAGNAETVKLVLGAGAPVNAADGRGTTPLLLAVRQGDVEIVRLLVAAGADVDAREARSGWSVLQWAIHEKHDDVARLLRAHGAEDDGSRTATLIAAVRAHDAGAVRRALADGASAKAKDERGVPVVIAAAGAGDAASVDALLGAGADPNAISQYDGTPLVAAARAGHLTTVERLLAAGARPTVRDRILGTPLYVATQWDHGDVVRVLLEAHADANDGSLAAAALAGRTQLVRLLLAAGADPNRQHGGVLREAARGGNPEVMRLLLDAGGDARLADDSGTTALHRAAGRGDAETVRLLLARRVDVDPREVNGYTPLMNAAAGGHVEVAKLLVAAGANVNARDDDGKTVVQRAGQRAEMVEMLRTAGASG